MFWTLFNWFLVFAVGVVVLGGALLSWFIVLALLMGWIPFDDGKHSNLD